MPHARARGQNDETNEETKASDVPNILAVDVC